MWNCNFFSLSWDAIDLALLWISLWKVVDVWFTYTWLVFSQTKLKLKGKVELWEVGKHLITLCLAASFLFSGDTLGSFVYVPCEVIKQRMQIQGTSSSWSSLISRNSVPVKPRGDMYGYYTGMFHAGCSIWKEQGPRGLYAGYVIFLHAIMIPTGYPFSRDPCYYFSLFSLADIGLH